MVLRRSPRASSSDRRASATSSSSSIFFAALISSNYNFGSKYFWARGRVSVPFGYLGRQTSRIGAEIVGQGGGKNGRKSNSFQAGPTLEYAWTPNFRTTGVIGYKSVGGEIFTDRQSAAYFKLEGSFSP